MEVLVTGGTGLVGGALVPELVRRGHSVGIASRHASRVAERLRRTGIDVEPFDLDVVRDDDLHGAAEHYDAIVHLAGSTEDEALNVEGTRRVVAEAERCGVRRLVYVSALGVERASTAFQRAKLAAEEAVRAFSGEWVIVRPGGVYGPRDHVVTVLARMVRTAPVVPLVDDGRQPWQPIWHEDLGRALAAAVERRDVVGHVLEVAGDDVTNPRELVEKLGALVDEPVHVVSIPARLAPSSSRLAARLGFTPPLDEAKLDLLLEGIVVDPPEKNALRALGVEPTHLDDGLRALVHDLPLQTPFEGTGPVYHKVYRAPVRHPKRGPEELVALFRDRFVDVMPLDFHAEPGAARRLELGNTLALRVPMRGTLLMRVVEVEPRRVTIATVSGHAISGAVRFSAEHDDDGAIAFVIEIYARPSNWVDRAALGSVGRVVEDVHWRRTARRAARLAEGRVRRPIERRAETLRGSEARAAEARITQLGRDVERPDTMA